MTGEATQVGTLRRVAKATSSRLHQHQKLTHTERGDSWGLCAPIPAVVYDDTQACELGRGVDPRSFSRISHWPFPSLAADRRAHQITLLLGCVRNSPARAVTGCAGAFPFAAGSGSRPAVGNTSAHHQPVNAIGDVPHVSINLSKPGSSAGFKTSRKELQGRGNSLRERGFFFQGTRRHD